MAIGITTSTYGDCRFVCLYQNNYLGLTPVNGISPKFWLSPKKFSGQ